MLEHSKVCIVIPFYNGDEFLNPCLASIYSNSYTNVSVCIVNNSSKDTLVDEIAGNYPSVHVIHSSPGIGFGRANNIGAEYALKIGAKYIIVLNQDTILDPYCISNLIRPFGLSHRIAVTAPISFTYDFKAAESHFIQWYLKQCPSLFADLLRREVKSYYPMKEVSGSCFAIRSSVVAEYGLFDELYFMYMEDVDLCRKIRSLNLDIVIVPSAEIAHAHSHTSVDENSKSKINWQKRRSRGIFILKETSKSKRDNLLQLIRVNLEDYLNLLTRMKLGHLVRALTIDLKVLGSVRTISKSRSKEVNLKTLTGKNLQQFV